MADLTDRDIELLKSGAKLRETATRSIGLSTFSSGVTATYFGHNIYNKGSIATPHREQYGHVFFSKPRLNLSYHNIRKERTFIELLTPDKVSRNMAIRAMLDPVLAKQGVCDTPLIDPDYAYMPLLSNELKSLTGWRDPFAETYTSNSGVQKEQWSMNDGPAKFYGTFELNASFRNIASDPFPYMFHVWTTYQSLVYQDILKPYPEAIHRNEIDYQTSILRLVLDQNRKYVIKWMSVPAAFPITNPIGSSGNFNEETPFISEAEEYSVSFKCMGAEYFDPINLYEFNLRNMMFNPNMADGVRQTKYRKLRDNEKSLFNMSAYPWIDLKTRELEWYVDPAVYKATLGD